MPLDFPPIFLLSTRLEPDELHRLKDSVPSLTHNIREAQVVLGNISRRERARFELRRLKLETEPVLDAEHQDSAQPGAATRHGLSPAPPDTVKVLKLSWLTDCLREGALLPDEDYLVYRGRRLPLTSTPASSPTEPATASTRPRPPASLAHETTSEHELPLPPVPDFLHTTYSCQRPTPMDPANAAFIHELGNIRTLRLLEGDKIGVRAYSTFIATLAAYPHALQSPREIARLPGCHAKIAELFQQWQATGQTRETAEAASDPKMAVLGLFYGIWGVGDTAAREFYAKGWRDLDDVVEYGWASLSRDQQIGVKYYDDFQLNISRHEVEAIADVVLSHARKVDAGFDMAIVGGYRRGKRESGDVDVVLSHRDESKTLNLIDRLVLSLEKSGFITHTLSLWTRNSGRGQVPLPWKGEASSRGTGFDTLDKAMVVWQDPDGGSKTGGQSAPHRRVDLIVSPWKTVGCALLGWTGGTTFQRDLRRYCKQEKGLKFDSSGVRRRADGEWVDLERRGAGLVPRPAPDMETAEKRVFEGLGLPWRPPEERCTG